MLRFTVYVFRFSARIAKAADYSFSRSIASAKTTFLITELLIEFKNYKAAFDGTQEIVSHDRFPQHIEGTTSISIALFLACRGNPALRLLPFFQTSRPRCDRQQHRQRI